MADGWIKLHRSLLSWEWWSDINVVRLWIYILLSVNHEDKKWRGIDIPRGTFVTSFKNLATETALTDMETRTAVKKLELSGEISRRTTNRYQAITVVNWELYQINGRGKTGREASDRWCDEQTDNKLLTTTKEDKNIRTSERKKKADIDCLIEQFSENMELRKALYDFVEMRRAIGSPITTARGMNGILNKLAKFHDAQKIAMVNDAVMNNWKSVYPSKAVKATDHYDDGFISVRNLDYEKMEMEAIQKLNKKFL